MKFLIRWAIRLFVVFVVLLVALVLLRDTLLQALTEYRVRSNTGLEVKIGRFETGLSSPRLTLENFKLYNSADFGGSPLVDIAELHLECDPAALAFQKLHLKLLRLNLSEVNIVESKDGRTNIVTLMDRIQERSSKSSSEPKTAMGLEFQGIDTLNLTVGKVKYSSLRKPSGNVEFEVGLKNEVLTNVKSMEDLSGLLLKVIFRRGINVLSGGGSPMGLFPEPAHPAGTNFARSTASLSVVARKRSLTNAPAGK